MQNSSTYDKKEIKSNSVISMLKKAIWRLERSNNMETECKVDLSFWKNSIKEKQF